MRKISRADETYDVNFRTASDHLFEKNMCDSQVSPHCRGAERIELEGEMVAPVYDDNPSCRFNGTIRGGSGGVERYHNKKDGKCSYSCLECQDHINDEPEEDSLAMRMHGSSVRTAGVWPNQRDYDIHKEHLNELLRHNIDGIKWHTKQGDHRAAQKHAAVAGAITGTLAAIDELEKQ